MWSNIRENPIIKVNKIDTNNYFISLKNNRTKENYENFINTSQHQTNLINIDCPIFFENILNYGIKKEMYENLMCETLIYNYNNNNSIQVFIKIKNNNLNNNIKEICDEFNIILNKKVEKDIYDRITEIVKDNLPKPIIKKNNIKLLIDIERKPYAVFGHIYSYFVQLYIIQDKNKIRLEDSLFSTENKLYKIKCNISQPCANLNINCKNITHIEGNLYEFNNISIKDIITLSKELNKERSIIDSIHVILQFIQQRFNIELCNIFKNDYNQQIIFKVINEKKYNYDIVKLTDLHP
jgi:hypothetical protein